MSQVDQIFNYMLAIPGRRISTWIAYEQFRCTTICQRIADLKKRQPFQINNRQFIIKDELVTKDGKTYSEYWLEPVKHQMELTF
jgi:hypothetical protein